MDEQVLFISIVVSSVFIPANHTPLAVHMTFGTNTLGMTGDFKLEIILMT